MNADMVAAVVVDIDDTVYLERDYVRSGFAAVESLCRSRHGVGDVGNEAWRLFEAGVRRTTLSDALARVGADPALLAELIDVYRSHRPAINLLPDAAAFIHRVVGRLPLGVVTDGPARSQRAKCEALGMDAVADPLVVTEEHGSAKPDPAMFLRAADGWDVPPHQVVYVADNPAKDFSGPLALGWQAIRLRRPGSLHWAADTPAGIVEIDSFDHPALACRAASFAASDGAVH